MIGYLRLPLSWIAHSDRVGIPLMRVAIAIVFLWIGALKFAPYEADSITPFVANSPFMSFFYEHPTEYKAHLTHEGELKPAERAWQTANNTCGFSDGLGTVEIAIGLLTLLGVFSRRWGIVGATLSSLPPDYRDALVAKVQGEYETKLNALLGTPAGKAYVAWQAAGNVEFAKALTFSSAEGIPAVLRLRQFAEQFMGAR